MSVRRRIAWTLVILLLFAGFVAAIYRVGCEHATAAITYMKAPRQAAVGQPAFVTLRGRWPAPGYRLVKARVEQSATTLTFNLMGRRWRGHASRGADLDFETSIRLPDLPSAVYALDAGGLGSMDLTVFRWGSSVAPAAVVGRRGAVRSMAGPVVAEIGKPFAIRLSGRWTERDSTLRRVDHRSVGRHQIAVAAVGNYNANEQALEPGQSSSFAVATDLTLDEAGFYEITSEGDEAVSLLVQAVPYLGRALPITMPVPVLGVTAPTTAAPGETVPVDVSVRATQQCTVQPVFMPSDGGTTVRLLGRWERNEQIAQAGLGSKDERMMVAVGKAGSFEITIEDSPLPPVSILVRPAQPEPVT